MGVSHAREFVSQQNPLSFILFFSSPLIFCIIFLIKSQNIYIKFTIEMIYFMNAYKISYIIKVINKNTFH